MATKRPPEVTRVAAAWAKAGRAAGLSRRESTAVAFMQETGEWIVGPAVERMVPWSLAYRDGEWATVDHRTGIRSPLPSVLSADASASAAFG